MYIYIQYLCIRGRPRVGGALGGRFTTVTVINNNSSNDSSNDMLLLLLMMMIMIIMIILCLSIIACIRFTGSLCAFFLKDTKVVPKNGGRK